MLENSNSVSELGKIAHHAEEYNKIMNKYYPSIDIQSLKEYKDELGPIRQSE
jgi:hypothetical protein